MKFEIWVIQEGKYPSGNRWYRLSVDGKVRKEGYTIAEASVVRELNPALTTKLILIENVITA